MIHIKVLMCKAYMHVQDYQLANLDPKVEKCEGILLIKRGIDAMNHSTLV